MTTQHTPGPWFAHGRNILNSASCKGNSCRQLAHISDMPDEMTAEELQANARLIAQAPAMLRALQNLVETLEGMAVHPSHYAQARATIARATGQPEPDEDEGPEPPYAGYESEAELRRMAEVRALRAKGQG